MSQTLINDCVRRTLDQYFRDLGGEEPAGLHELMVRSVERPLLEQVMSRAEGNQSLAAQWLGINRNTLRRKLLEHGLAG
ncbi:MAG: Fis family transcriptional regulator [Betaproteobacteria bacterium]|jgi:Fis family transcriptional regulator, factor for inversion stimulation protein|nr:Fis family transcriptional regulator [Betaproteobacteria bacterium]NBT09965.1 Fis family transcriptional regulator [Betaproteobacteria bacterium]NBU50283.1 Fis family transcriptional regulator [Betaproteobacteria bacterium]NBX96195.1 Fis family transcriptional regulator [Betaproteobacteria bacterium]